MSRRWYHPHESDPGELYNGDDPGGADDATRDGKMRKTLTTIRCVPRFGYDYAEVRTIDLDLLDVSDEKELRQTLQEWFTLRGLPDAIFDINWDDYGHLAIVNDDAFLQVWGEPLL